MRGVYAFTSEFYGSYQDWVPKIMNYNPIYNLRFVLELLNSCKVSGDNAGNGINCMLECGRENNFKMS